MHYLNEKIKNLYCFQYVFLIIIVLFMLPQNVGSRLSNYLSISTVRTIRDFLKGKEKEFQIYQYFYKKAALLCDLTLVFIVTNMSIYCVKKLTFCTDLYIRYKVIKTYLL